MNRNHVGMIFKFLPKDEQEELRNLKPEEREVYTGFSNTWKNCEEVNIQDTDIYLCYRPKGFLSWVEIAESIESRCNGKKVEIVKADLIVESFQLNTSKVCWKKYVDTTRDDYGFEVIE